MKLTNLHLKKLILEVLKEEDPEEKKPAPPQPTGGGEDSKELKIDIPNSPFTPDISQVQDRLKDILKQWEIKKYTSDEHRWKSYYKDISILVKKIEGYKE